MSKVVNISEAASIAFHAMILIVRSNKPLNASKIADRIHSSKHHVAKVLLRLAKAGYINSVREPSGGFFMKLKPENITFLNIYESIEGRFNYTKCKMQEPLCSFDKCIYNNINEKMTFDFIEYLQSQKAC
ncbi:MAG: Rrf2 family transcriptional regulator [Bacteroidota bacterium]